MNKIDKQDEQLTKREQRMWKEFEVPSQLADALSLLTKGQLDSIRKNLDLKGMSTLKKGELVQELSRIIPVSLERALITFDQERYELVQKAAKSKTAVPTDLPMSKIEHLLESGLVFPVIHNGRPSLTMPTEVASVFAEMDGEGIRKTIQRNTEWIQLTHGMLHYYGVYNFSEMIDKISGYMGEEVNLKDYLNVFYAAKDYHEQVRSTSYGVEDQRVFDAKTIVDQHDMRANVDFYPFTKKQLLKAGKPGYFERTPKMERFLNFLLDHYDFTKEELDEIGLHVVEIFNMHPHPADAIRYLETRIEFPSLEFLKELTNLVFDLYNHTPQWALKGYSPTELGKKTRNQLHPLNSARPAAASNVIDMTSRSKTGRNEPCSCGSGKKYKKCCGK